jgi:hypothetical protein
MAITKVSYTRSKPGAKASLDYYTHRPNREGELQTRELFGRDGPLSKRHGYLLIDRAGGDTVFLRIALSPDPNLEDGAKDLNLRELTEQTIARLQKRLKQKLIQYIAIEHADQTEIRHTHIIALVRAKHLTHGKLSLKDLDELYKGATADALQMRQEIDQDRGLTRQAEPTQVAQVVSAHEPQLKREAPGNGPGTQRYKPVIRRSDRRERSSGSGGQPRQAPTCPNCGPYSTMEGYGRFFECPNCGMAASRSYGLGFAYEQGKGLELTLEEVSGG